MKLYVLRERWGKYVLSSRAPGAVEIPPEPVEEAGVGIHMIDWGDWWLIPFAEKVIIWNYLATYAIDYLGLSGSAAVKFIQLSITKSIAREAAWVLWKFAGLVGVYAAISMIAVYYSPDVVDFVMAETAPIRYIMRYRERLWMADLRRITDAGKPEYRCYALIGDVLIGEQRNVFYPLGRADRWDTGFTWVQKKSRFIHYESWSWSDVWVEYIGLMENLGGDNYSLKAGCVDPYVAELPPGFYNLYIGREWDPDYRVP